MHESKHPALWFGGSHEEDEWWGRKTPNRNTVAFHAGRLVNRVNWTLQQYVVTAGFHRHEVGPVAVVDKLVALACDLGNGHDFKAKDALVRLKGELPIGSWSEGGQA